MADADPFVTTVTSQEEGVFVGVDSLPLSGTKSEEADTVRQKKNHHHLSDTHTTARDSTSSIGGEDAFEEYLFSEEGGGSNHQHPVKTPIEKSIEMTSSPSATPVTFANSNDNDDSPPSPGYYTAAPSVPTSSLSFLQTLREYRHNRCIMTPLSTLVLLAMMLSGLVSLLFAIPQFVIGLFLGPLLKRQFWLVEFLYRWDVAGWGHIKLMELAGKQRNGKKGGNSKDGGGNRGMKDPKKKLKHLGLLGHSDTIHQRITVVPGRVYVHPIPQFVDNVCYLIVCLPRSKDNDDDDATTDNNENEEGKTDGLPIIGILVDVGEAKRTLAYMECIYEQFYERAYPRSDYYRNSGQEEGNVNTAGMGIEVHAILSTHRHHDHTAGIGEMVKCLEQARCRLSKCVFVTGAANGQDESNKVYHESPGKVVVVGGAVESVPHCNLFVKNGCFIPLPCVTIDVNGTKLVNDMNSAVCIEVIGVPSHTRGSVVYALRNYHTTTSSPKLDVDDATAHSHLFTGDAIFSGGGGVPFEADLEHDNFIKKPNKLKNKNGSSNFRPGAGALSMERAFTEVLTMATKRICEEENVNLADLQSRVLLYPGHEYTTDLVLRQFDPKTISNEGQWTRMAPSVYFETAAHYFVAAHKRALPQGQKLLSIPTSLDKEMIVNPNFRSLKRRGEHVVNALKLWHEFGVQNQLPRFEVEAPEHTIQKRESSSPFQTVFAQDLDAVVLELREGVLSGEAAADRIEKLQARVDEKLIGRRPIPNHLPSHRNVYLGVVALAILGSPPSGVTVSDALIMDLASPVDCSDYILISKSRLTSALNCLGLISPNEPYRIQDIINLLWKESQPDYDLKLGVDNSIKNIGETDLVELGLIKLALFGISLNQPASRYCLPCGGSKPRYSEMSWTVKSKMKRTNGELVRHDAEECPLCRDVLVTCPHSVYI